MVVGRELCIGLGKKTILLGLVVAVSRRGRLLAKVLDAASDAALSAGPSGLALTRAAARAAARKSAVALRSTRAIVVQVDSSRGQAVSRRRFGRRLSDVRRRVSRVLVLLLVLVRENLCENESEQSSRSMLRFPVNSDEKGIRSTRTCLSLFMMLERMRVAWKQ